MEGIEPTDYEIYGVSLSNHNPYPGRMAFVVEQDEPFDPLNVRRNGPGTVMADVHHPSYLVEEPWPGLILRIFAIHVTWNFNSSEPSIQMS